MTMSEFDSLPLALFAVLTTANALTVAVNLFAMRRVARSSSKTAMRSADMKRFEELAIQVTELQDSHDALFASHTKLRSRVGMRVNREQKAEEGDDGDVDWKKRKRRELGAALLTPGIANRKN